MRYGFFSDIHSNLEAFEEALKFYKKEKIDQFIFLGDIIGYGANPREAIALLKTLKSQCIAGNHDWAIADKLSDEYFNEYARQALVWTKKAVTAQDVNYLRGFPLTYEKDNFFCIHGSLIEPERFNYILGINDARLNFELLTKQILFVGHSHRAQIYYLNSGGIFFHPGIEVSLKENEKYIINVGSIGQPRDRDRRLSVCVYDSDEALVRITRLDYNISLAADKILKAGLPAMLASRLFIGL